MRPTIDETLMKIAQVWEERSTCTRNRVGAVIAKDGRHIGSGYNGAPAGMPHCQHSDEEARAIVAYPPFVASGCQIARHAECNAIAYSARHGVGIEGGTIYTTLSPCYLCAQTIIAAGLVRVVYNRKYRDQNGLHLLTAAGVIVDSIGWEP